MRTSTVVHNAPPQSRGDWSAIQMNEEQTQARLRELANEAAAIFDRADAEGRELTADERTEAEHKMARAKDLQAKVQLTDVAGRIGGNATNGDSTGFALQGDPGEAFVQSPGAVIMHPANWLASRMLRDGTGGTVGQFYGGGSLHRGLWHPRRRWPVRADALDLPVALSTIVGAGTAIVGNFRSAAVIYRRSGVVVEATNSHASLFLTDQVAIRAEERLGLPTQYLFGPIPVELP
jgi:Phage capsid family